MHTILESFTALLSECEMGRHCWNEVCKEGAVRSALFGIPSRTGRDSPLQAPRPFHRPPRTAQRRPAVWSSRHRQDHAGEGGRTTCTSPIGRGNGVVRGVLQHLVVVADEQVGGREREDRPRPVQVAAGVRREA